MISRKEARMIAEELYIFIRKDAGKATKDALLELKSYRLRQLTIFDML